MARIVHALSDVYVVLESLYWPSTSLEGPGLNYILDPKNMAYSRGSVYFCCVNEQMNDKDNNRR